MTVSDVVILIPGFLGFDRIGHFPYFANRVGAALRGCIVGLAGVDIPVIPVKTCPTESLVDRQLELLRTLQHINSQFDSLERFHLIGHSTGGVDAYLLTGKVPLRHEISWQDVDPDHVRDKIRTVTTIASPHKGTCLALSPLARFFRHPITSIDKSYSLARVLFQLPFSLHVDEMALGGLLGAVTDTGGAAAYILDTLRARTLVDDLQPQHMVAIHEQFEQGLEEVQVRTVVTMAGKHMCKQDTANGTCHMREPDAFFKSIYGYAAGSGFDEWYDDYDAIEEALDTIQALIPTEKQISNPDTTLYEITPKLNDGLVNTARQLIHPEDEDELLAIVVGDHIDVIGYYPQWAPDCRDDDEEKDIQMRSGILHSGSGFSDEQFFAMLQRIAKAIVSQVPDQEAMLNL